MSEPLSQWYCDVCGELIDRAEDGYVLWKTDGDLLGFDFKIIHKVRCDRGGYPCSNALDQFLGFDGLTYLMGFLSVGPIKAAQSQSRVRDLDEFVDFVRRVQIPWYEEARRRFDDEEVQLDYQDGTESAPYRQDALRGIANV